MKHTLSSNWGILIVVSTCTDKYSIHKYHYLGREMLVGKIHSGILKMGLLFSWVMMA